MNEPIYELYSIIIFTINPQDTKRIYTTNGNPIKVDIYTSPILNRIIRLVLQNLLLYINSYFYY